MNRKTAKKSALPKLADFVGIWVDYKRVFLGHDVMGGPRSHWVILPGNKVMKGDKLITCRVTKSTIKMSYGKNKHNYWQGEMQPNGTLRISTANLMMTYLCKRATKRSVAVS